ncbi:hypothetical protein ILYODFUR_036473 [Ilyodon furcidens]|uniref:Uncharacterized protein n=1 Tax=Ilyodon furcidens TaxID=33524 RepID=A0ABV0TQ44_9TELE
MDTDAKGIKNALTSQYKTPVPDKKTKGDEEDGSDAPNAKILAAVENLQKMMNFGEEMKQNMLPIANIAKVVEFNGAEIQECNNKNQEIEKEITQFKAINTELTKNVEDIGKKTAESERYKRRWNLHIIGLKEEKEEDTRQIVVDIIKKIMPHWKEKMDMILDTVHQLGPNNFNRPRQIIIQFTGRIFRDELWRSSKQHPTCRELNIWFAEDLIKEDREARLTVWPKVEQASKAGIKAIFKGQYTFING